MYPLLFSIIYRLSLFTSRYISYNGKRAIKVQEKKIYRPLIGIITWLESMILARTEFFSSSAMEKVQVSKMKHLLKTASRMPFWKDRITPNLPHFEIFSNISDIKKLPILTRDTIQTNFNEGNMLNLSVPLRRRVFATTSGSTGQPLAFFSDTILISQRRACYHRMIRWFLPAENMFVIKVTQAFPFWLINFSDIQSFQLKNDENMNAHFADLYTFLRSQLQHHSTKVLIDMYPSNIMRFVQMINESKLDGSQILGFMAGSETLLPGEREYVKKVLSCEIRMHYGSTEFGSIAVECGMSPEHSYHIHAEYFYVEIVDDEGKPVVHGATGRVVITSFDNEVMPCIRYDTGDLGRFITTPCPCGRTLPLLAIEGRQAHLITLPNGKSITQFSIFRIFHFPNIVKYVRQFQIVHEAPTRVTINMILNTAQDPRLDNFLRSGLSETLGKEVSISLNVVKDISVAKNGKRKGYVSTFA